MNSLSWLIYFAGIAGTLSGFSVFLTVATGFISVIGFIWWCAGKSDGYETASPTKLMAIAMPLCIFFGIFAAIIPDKNTVYAIAASEVGEEIIKTKTYNKGLEALESWLDKQIAENKSHTQHIEELGKEQK